jgi:beta-phosphoglucomutase-like phosphatase (HAD superfamily)
MEASLKEVMRAKRDTQSALPLRAPESQIEGMGIAELLASLQAVIFDVDGTLVSSNDAHAHAWQHALAEHGLHVPYEHIRRRMGMESDALLPMVATLSFASALGQRIDRSRQQYFLAEQMPGLHATPGASELFRSLRRHHIACAIVSSASPAELLALLALAGVTPSEGLLQSVANTVRHAVETLALEPARIAMVGDSPYDVDAAMAAGIPLIALRTGGYSDEILREAVVIYDDPRALRRAFEGAFSRSRQSASAR